MEPVLAAAGVFDTVELFGDLLFECDGQTCLLPGIKAEIVDVAEF